jgi:hypothetical protein
MRSRAASKKGSSIWKTSNEQQFCIAFRERLKRRALRMLFVRGRLGSKKVAQLPAPASSLRNTLQCKYHYMSEQ